MEVLTISHLFAE